MPTNIRVSPPAAEALVEFREHVKDHPAWLETTSYSVLIEFLVEHALRGVSMTKFKAKTRRGRPPGFFQHDNARPARFRVD